MLFGATDRIKKFIGNATEKYNVERNEDKTQGAVPSNPRLLKAQSWMAQSRTGEDGTSRRAMTTVLRLDRSRATEGSRTHSSVPRSTGYGHDMNTVSKPHSLSRPDSSPHMKILYLDPELAPPLIGDAIIWNKIFETAPIKETARPIFNQRTSELSITISKPGLGTLHEPESPSSDEDMTPTQRLPTIENSEAYDWVRSMDHLFQKASNSLESHKEFLINSNWSGQDLPADDGVDNDGISKSRLRLPETRSSLFLKSEVPEHRKLSLEQTGSVPEDRRRSKVHSWTPSITLDLLSPSAATMEHSADIPQVNLNSTNDHDTIVHHNRPRMTTEEQKAGRSSSETIRSVPKSTDIPHVSSNQHRISPDIESGHSHHSHPPHLAYLLATGSESCSKDSQKISKALNRDNGKAKSAHISAGAAYLEFDNLLFPSPPRRSQHLQPKTQGNPRPAIPDTPAKSRLHVKSSTIKAIHHRQRSESPAPLPSKNFAKSSPGGEFLESTAYSMTCPLFKHGKIRLRGSLKLTKSQRDQMRLSFDGVKGDRSPDRDEPLDWTAFQMAISGGAGDFLHLEGDSKTIDEEGIIYELETEIDDLLEWWSGIGFREDLIANQNLSRTIPPRNERSTGKTKIREEGNSGISIMRKKERSKPPKNSEGWLSHNIYELEAAAVESSSTERRERGRYLDDDSDRSLPDSPMADLNPEALQRKGSVVLMGFNLGHDLGDFLRWEAEYVESIV